MKDFLSKPPSNGSELIGSQPTAKYSETPEQIDIRRASELLAQTSKKYVEELRSLLYEPRKYKTTGWEARLEEIATEYRNAEAILRFVSQVKP